MKILIVIVLWIACVGSIMQGADDASICPDPFNVQSLMDIKMTIDSGAITQDIP